MRTSDKVAAQFNDSDRKDLLHDQITMWAQENAGYIYYEVNKNRINEHNSEDSLLATLDNLKCIWEQPLHRERNFIAGYADLLITYDGESKTNFHGIACEIKPRIDSIADVIRQIRYYKTLNIEGYMIAEFCVISPDDRYAKLLEDQDIHFIKYTP